MTNDCGTLFVSRNIEVSGNIELNMRIGHAKFSLTSEVRFLHLRTQKRSVYPYDELMCA